MSFNQSRSDKNETQYRKTGRSASSNQQHRGFSPSYPKGTGAGGPGPSISTNRRCIYILILSLCVYCIYLLHMCLCVEFVSDQFYLTLKF